MSRGHLSRGSITIAGNCPDAIIWGVIFLSGIWLGAIVWGVIVQGAIVLGGNFPGGNCPGGNCPKWHFSRGGGNCLESICPGQSCPVPIRIEKNMKEIILNKYPKQ